VREIEYNPPMDSAIFQPDLPDAPAFEGKEETALEEGPLRIRFASTGVPEGREGGLPSHFGECRGEPGSID